MTTLILPVLTVASKSEKNPTDYEVVFRADFHDRANECERFFVECGTLRVETTINNIRRTVRMAAFQGAMVSTITFADGTKGLFIQKFL